MRTKYIENYTIKRIIFIKNNDLHSELEILYFSNYFESF